MCDIMQLCERRQLCEINRCVIADMCDIRHVCEISRLFERIHLCVGRHLCARDDIGVRDDICLREVICVREEICVFLVAEWCWMEFAGLGGFDVRTCASSSSLTSMGFASLRGEKCLGWYFTDKLLLTGSGWQCDRRDCRRCGRQTAYMFPSRLREGGG